MAVIYGSIQGVKILTADVGTGVTMKVAEVSFTMPAYTGSSDNGKLGAGGYDSGTATTDTLATMIGKRTRNGKTVTLFDACLGRPGKHSSTVFYANTFAVSSGSLTFNVCDSSGSETDAASGVSDIPLTVLVAFTEA